MSEAFRTKGNLEGPQSDVLWEYGCTGVLQDGDDLVGYFPSQLPLPLSGHWESVDDMDYVKQYFDTLEPIFLERLIIAPTHREITPSKNQRVIWLDPGMAFGTGHHETTYMALQALETLELEGKSVLDVGTGSGILAMAASHLGSAAVIGIDIDPQAIIVARENAELNNITLDLLDGTLEGQSDRSADIIIANLFAELHVMLATHYQRVLKPQGHLIITGILSEKSSMVREALSTHFIIEHTNTRGEWTLFQLTANS
jgi:ribosomal protein L11 methyltransferase